MITRPTKEEYLEYMKYVIENILRKKIDSIPCYKDTLKEKEIMRNLIGTSNIQIGEPNWAFDEGKLYGMCMWFGYEVEDNSPHYILVKRANRVILDSRQFYNN